MKISEVILQVLVGAVIIGVCLTIFEYIARTNVG
jgi:hypothetical protein